MSHAIITLADLSEFLEERLAYCHSFKILTQEEPGIVNVAVYVDHSLGSVTEIQAHLNGIRNELKERMPVGIMLNITEMLQGPYR